MKPLLLIALVTLGGVTCGPVSIRDNNFGDITAIAMNIDANVQRDLNVNIANVILALLVNIGNGQPPPVGPQLPPTTASPPDQPTVHPPITPPITTPIPLATVEELVQAIEEVRVKAANLSQEQKDQLWHEHVEPFVKKVVVYQN